MAASPKSPTFCRRMPMQELPTDMIREIPLVRGHRFVKLDDRILVISATSRLVVAMIPRYKILPSKGVRMPTSGYLSQSLRRPLPTKDDGILRTVADAAAYMMALSEDRQRAHWQRAARLLLDEAHAHDLSRQVELALFYDRQLDLRSSRLQSGESSTMHA